MIFMNDISHSSEYWRKYGDALFIGFRSHGGTPQSSSHIQSLDHDLPLKQPCNHGDLSFFLMTYPPVN